MISASREEGFPIRQLQTEITDRYTGNTDRFNGVTDRFNGNRHFYSQNGPHNGTYSNDGTYYHNANGGTYNNDQPLPYYHNNIAQTENSSIYSIENLSINTLTNNHTR